MNIKGNECGSNEKGFWVYLGYNKSDSKLVYVGTTMQKPSDRFRWHRHNGKDLRFEVKCNLDSAEKMFEEELRLIKKYNPTLNKKTTKHNDNRKANAADISKRIGDECWCQKCLKRRVNKGYVFCMWCS